MVEWSSSLVALVVWTSCTVFFLSVYTCVVETLAVSLQESILRNKRAEQSLLQAGRASWTNIGVVSALGLTIAGAMVQSDPISEPLSAIGQAYAYCSWIAYGLFLTACIQASLAVIYTDVLYAAYDRTRDGPSICISVSLLTSRVRSCAEYSSEDQMKLLLESKKSILTRPLLAFIFAFAHAGVGFGLSMWDAYGDVAAVFIFGLFPTTYIGIYVWWKDLNTFSQGGGGAHGAYAELQSRED